jgi:formamidopyrimidine-DNA glycosylase
MVEGHAVQRLAAAHRRSLLRRAFRASSPNARFIDGAAAIDGRTLVRVEAIGKNLFHFYADTPDPPDMSSSDLVVAHMHFGMRLVQFHIPRVCLLVNHSARAVFVLALNLTEFSCLAFVFSSGQFRTCPTDRAPDAKPTTRLRLQEVVSRGAATGSGITGMVSAQLLVYGGFDVYESAKSRLGEDPLRDDADPQRFYEKALRTSRSIGAILMDQEVIAGVGNVSHYIDISLYGSMMNSPANVLQPLSRSVVTSRFIAPKYVTKLAYTLMNRHAPCLPTSYSASGTFLSISCSVDLCRDLF